MTQAKPPTDSSAPAQSPEREAVAWLHTARFLTTSAQLHQLPEHNVPEIAFVGRSNAGKSSAINALTQQKRLAFSSKTPGRTQHINLFAVGRQGQTDCALADLPGYGYAAVPQAAKERWQRVMANYLVSRPQLKAVVMLCDSRHGIREIDEYLLHIIRERVEQGLQFLILLTKTDKLTKVEAKKAQQIAQLQAAGGTVMLFSVPSKTGVAAASLWLHEVVKMNQPAEPEPLPDGDAQAQQTPQQTPQQMA